MRSFIVLLLSAIPLSAQDAPALAFPVDCTLGETCMIQQLMDHDPTDGARDFLCGPMTYDGHSGTDIRVPDMEALAQGVQILAAAPGTVLGTRNTVPDTGRGTFPEGQHCGNGVLIEHENGWQTQYCHMAQGSVSVTTGVLVQTGQLLGNMGFSGETEFPHMQISVRHNGIDVDPFDPSAADTCGTGADPLWTEDIAVSPGGILSLGFAETIPDFEAIRAGTADASFLNRDVETVVLWGFFYGGRSGDFVRIEIAAPDGSTFHSHEVELERTQAELFRASGRRNRTELVTGDYTGTVTLIRNGATIDVETTTITVD